MIYEALVGRAPFLGPPLEVLMDKQRREPTPPRALSPTAPADLEALCLELLRFDPRARPSGAQVLARLGAEATLPKTPSSGGAPPFVGRRRELDLLNQAFDETREGRAQLLLLHGESGLGKSALVRHFVAALERAQPGTVALAGRCYERESVPYKAFDGVVDALSQYLGQLDPVDAALLLPSDAALLAQVFPVLRRVPAVARAAMPAARRLRNALELRSRAFAALRELFRRLAERTPLVVFIDDFQWADGDSRVLLGELMHPPAAPPLLLVATVRAGDEPALLPGGLGALEVRRVRLEALSRDESRELVRLLGGSGDAIADEARGHPLFLHELVRHQAQAGAQPVRLDEALWARIAQLEPPARRLLEVVALAGAPLPFAVAAEAGQLDGAALARWTGLLRVANLLRSGGTRGADTVEPYHDRVREAVLAHLDGEARRELHRRLAAALEGAGAAVEDPQVLVRHLEAAGETERAARQAERAAERAAEALAFEQAAALYRTALGLGRHDPAERRRLQIALGDALANAGRGPEAADQYLASVEGADAAARLDCQRRAAEHLLGSGHIERGLDTLGAVLREVGEKMPSTPRRALWSLTWNRLRLRLRGLGWYARDPTQIAARDLVRLDIYKAVANSMGFVDNIRAADFQARGLLLALRTGERHRVGRAIAMEAIFVSTQGRRSLARAGRLVDQAQQIAAACNDPYLTALSVGAAGAIDYYSGRFRAAAAAFRDAEVGFREQQAAGGAMWEFNNLHLLRLSALRYVGACQEMRRLFDEVVRDAGRRGDRFAETSMTRGFNMVWLAADDPTQALDDLERKLWSPPEGGYHTQHWYELRARAEIALYRGVAASTLDDARGGFAALERSLLLRVQLVRAEAAWLRGRLALGAAAGGGPGALDEARRWARRLVRERMPYTRVWALLLEAAAAAQARRTPAALALLRQAADEAEGQHLELCAAAAWHRLGTLLGGSEGAALLARAADWMAVEEIRRPERMVEVVAPGFA
jgi:hypothetical protein